MRRLTIATLLCLTAGVGNAPHDVVARQAREASLRPTTGTASISGVVLDDEQPARPVRRAVVTLTGAGLRPNRGAITDDEGRFTLRTLPAGRFTLMAERGGFITSIYGARRPGRPGTAIAIADGQQIANLQVRIWRGAVLSGVVRDESGAPMANTPVAAIPARKITPATLTLSNSAQITTNEIGEFRIFGLEPGTYVVRAGVPSVGGLRPTEIAMSDAEIDAVFAALAARRQPGALPSPSGAANAADLIPMNGMPLTAAPFYFPGTPVPSDATPIAIAAGEERSGLDFTVGRVATSTVHGIVAMPDGTPVARAFVRLVANPGAREIPGTLPAPLIVSSGADGTFTYPQISPGDYALLVRGDAGSAATHGAGTGAGSFWWTTTQVSATGGDIDLGTLTLQPGMSFSGRVVFDAAATTAPPDPVGLRVVMESDALAQLPSSSRGGTTPGMRFIQPAAVHGDGSFTVTDLVPDEYRLTMAGNVIGDAGWWLRSAMLNGRDLLDAPLRIAPRENVGDVTLVLSDRHTELSGTLVTTSGAAVSAVFVIAFPADASLRVPHSRRVQVVRPDNGGRFVVRNLPAGDYLLCALTDVDEGEWDEPGFFGPLIAASAKVTIADGEKKVQDLRVGGG